jgi:hypothetical protein
MISFLPFFILGSSFFLAASKSKRKAKKAATHRVIESGPIENLPKGGEPILSMPLRVGEAIEIIASESPASSWKVTRQGMAVKMDRKSRELDRITSTIFFTFKAVSQGTTVSIFEKIGRRGQVLETRHLELIVE